MPHWLALIKKVAIPVSGLDYWWKNLWCESWLHSSSVWLAHAALFLSLCVELLLYAQVPWNSLSGPVWLRFVVRFIGFGRICRQFVGVWITRLVTLTLWIKCVLWTQDKTWMNGWKSKCVCAVFLCATAWGCILNRQGDKKEVDVIYGTNLNSCHSPHAAMGKISHFLFFVMLSLML